MAEGPPPQSPRSDGGFAKGTADRLADEIASANCRAGQAPRTPPEVTILQDALVPSPPDSRPVTGQTGLRIQPLSGRGSFLKSSLAAAGQRLSQQEGTLLDTPWPPQEGGSASSSARPSPRERLGAANVGLAAPASSAGQEDALAGELGRFANREREDAVLAAGHAAGRQVRWRGLQRDEQERLNPDATRKPPPPSADVAHSGGAEEGRDIERLRRSYEQQLEEIRFELEREQRRAEGLRRRNGELDRRMISERRRAAEAEGMREHLRQVEAEAARQEALLVTEQQKAQQRQAELQAATAEAAQLRVQCAEAEKLLQNCRADAELRAQAAEAKLKERDEQVASLTEVKQALERRATSEQAELREALSEMQSVTKRAREDFAHLMSQIESLKPPKAAAAEQAPLLKGAVEEATMMSAPPASPPRQRSLGSFMKELSDAPHELAIGLGSGASMAIDGEQPSRVGAETPHFCDSPAISHWSSESFGPVTDVNETPRKTPSPLLFSPLPDAALPAERKAAADCAIQVRNALIRSVADGGLARAILELQEVQARDEVDYCRKSAEPTE